MFPLVLILSAIVLSFFWLHVGLLILVLVVPFFTLLREMSAGSPIYYLWPFVLCGVMVVSIICREACGWLGIKCQRKWLLLSLSLASLASGIFFTLLWMSDKFHIVIAVAGMADFPRLLSNQNMEVLTLLMSLALLMFLGIFFVEMKRSEGKSRPLDYVVAAYVVYGLFHIIYTAATVGIVFVGLDGFRYSFFMAIVYFLGRYVIRSEKQERQLLIALGLACILGAAQMMVEGYMLNVLGIPHEETPWFGHLTKNWGYVPEGDRSFFEGGYRPLGLMYMTHLSGLFFLFGVALWMPSLLTSRTWKDAGIYVVPTLFVLLTVFWTSRTVLLLLVGTYVSAGLLLRVSWIRMVSGAAIMTLFCTFSSYYILPLILGFRYDVIEEGKYIATAAVSDNVKAIGVDWLAISGQGIGLPKEVIDESPPEWRLSWGRGSPWGYYTRRIFLQPMAAAYSLAIGSGPASEVWVRRVLSDTSEIRGEEIVIGGWVKANAPRLTWLRIHEHVVPPLNSPSHSGSGEWEFLATKYTVHPLSNKINVEIVVNHSDQDTDVALVGGVYAVIGGKLLTLMGDPSGFPWEQFPALKSTILFARRPDHETRLPGLADQSNLGTHDPPDGIKKLMQDHEPSLRKFHHYLLGRGMSFGGWSALFFPGERESRSAYVVQSYSDFKYLAFFEQFGVVGILLLGGMAIGAIGRGLRLSWTARSPDTRVRNVSLTLITGIGFVALLHLPSLFKLGINSSVYLVMGMLMRELDIAHQAAESP